MVSGVSLGGVHPMPGSDKPRVSVGEIWGEAVVCQSIHYFPGLSGVELLLATNNRQNRGPVEFSVRTSPEGTERLVSVTFDAADVEDNALYPIEFPPVRGLDVRILYFCLEAPEARPGNAITIWGARDDLYPGGEAILKGVSGNGVLDLAFRLQHERTLWDRASVLLPRVAANKPSVFGERRLYLLLALAYLGLVYVLFVHVLGWRREEGTEVSGCEGNEGQEATSGD